MSRSQILSLINIVRLFLELTLDLIKQPFYLDLLAIYKLLISIVGPIWLILKYLGMCAQFLFKERIYVYITLERAIELTNVYLAIHL